MIFLSYSWKNKEIVWKVAELLKQSLGDEQVYIDKKDNSLGEDYVKNFTKMINYCDTFIFFNSEDYKDSTACNAEQNIIIRDNKIQRIIEIKLDDTETPNHISHRNIYYDAKFKTEEDIVSEIINSKNGNLQKFISVNDYELVSYKPHESKIVLRAKRAIYKVKFEFYSSEKIRVDPTPWTGYSSSRTGTRVRSDGLKAHFQSIMWTELSLRQGETISLKINDIKHLFAIVFVDSITGEEIQISINNI